MQASQSEVSALSQKAACGAGLFWGLAEEAGRAARWLEAHELPGLVVFAELLALNDGKPYADLAPVETAERWHAARGDLCPLITGVALCDRAGTIVDHEHDVVELAGVSYPLLLLPFVARIAEAVGIQLLLSWQGAEISCTQSAVMIKVAEDSLEAHRAERVVIGRAKHPLTDTVIKSAHVGAVTVATSVWHRLEIFAHRTYVPASEASRQSGAGAGLIDND